MSTMPARHTRLPFVGVAALLGLVVTVGLVERFDPPGSEVPTATRAAERDLLFYDRADGAVLVETPSHAQVAVYQGQQGFLRGTLRGFARTRMLAGLGPETPFKLSRWSDGRLTLDDPATGEHVELEAFGPTNAAVFAPLLEKTP